MPKAALSTYMAAGRQYIAVPTGKLRQPAGLVALALPRGDAPDPDLALPELYYRTDADHPQYYRAVQALDAGDIDKLRQLLVTYPKLLDARGYLDGAFDRAGFGGATLLHHIAGEPIRTRLPANIVEVTRFLLEQGADPNAITTSDSAAVLALVTRSDQVLWNGVEKDLLETLISAGAQAGANDGRIVWETMLRGRTEGASVLVENLENNELRFAAGAGQIPAMAKFFAGAGQLNKAAYPRYRPPATEDGPEVPQTLTDQDVLDEALAFAVLNNQFEAVEFLLARGGNINSRPIGIWFPGDPGSTLLHKAVDVQATAMLRFLLEQGADPLLADKRWNSTARAWASYSGYIEGGNILLEYEKKVQANR